VKKEVSVKFYTRNGVEMGQNGLFFIVKSSFLNVVGLETATLPPCHPVTATATATLPHLRSPQPMKLVARQIKARQIPAIH
jgi:hypothetical protein